MKTRTNALALGACLLAGAALAGDEKSATAERSATEERNATFTMAVPAPMGGGHGGFMFHHALEGFEAKVVKGAPYSADAVTEMTQALADGNKISRTTRGSVARDGEGRTRREQMLGALGPLMAEKAPRAIFLNDPVAGVHYVLEPDEKIARKMPVPNIFRGEAGASASAHHVTRFQKRVVVNGAEVENVDEERVESSHPGQPAHPEGDKPRTESLGEKTIEGVTAEGTRTVVTIPAGRIGNERALEIVSERWYSPQLQAVVMSSHQDPRFGETVFRLTNISRDEPDAALFTVPADYTVKEGPPGDVIKRVIRRPRD
jgi:hypothetical protein